MVLKRFRIISFVIKNGEKERSEGAKTLCLWQPYTQLVAYMASLIVPIPQTACSAISRVFAAPLRDWKPFLR